MTYPVTKLITDAYCTAGIVSKEFDEVSGSQLDQGLESLNSLLNKKTLDQAAIPYFSEYNGTMVIGREEYFIPGLISIDTVTYFIGSVRYSTREADRKKYWGGARANNIQALPFNYEWELTFNTTTYESGANIFFYFLPSQNFPFQIWGLFALNEVSFNDDLDKVMSKFYRDFLKFELADRLCSDFNYVLPPGPQRELDEYRLLLDKREQRLDLVQQTMSPLANITDGINYAWVNLGTGWSVP